MRKRVYVPEVLTPDKETTVDPVIWIVIGVIALIVVIALIALATRSNSRRKLSEAAALRRDAQEREQALEREHAVAREHEHRAGAAEQEARAKSAEAEKLRVDADRHRQALAEQEHDVARMEMTADELDPHRRSASAGDPAVAPAGGGRVREPGVGGQDVDERGIREPGFGEDIAGGVHRRAEPLDEDPGRIDPNTPRR